MTLTHPRPPLLLVAVGFLVLAVAAAPRAEAAAAAGFTDKITVRGARELAVGAIVSESMDEIKLADGRAFATMTVTNIDYSDAPQAFRVATDRRLQTVYPEAIRYYEAAGRNPQVRQLWAGPACLYYVALCHLEQGEDLAAAEAKFRELLEKFPKTRFRFDALLGLGRVQYEAARYEAAIAQFTTLAKEAAAASWEDWQYMAYIWQARSLLEQGEKNAAKYDEALAVVKRVIALGPASQKFGDLVIQAKTIEAMVLVRKGEYKQAIEKLNVLIKEISPFVAGEVDKNADVRMQRTEAQCYNALGQAQLKQYGVLKSEEDLRRALLAYLWTVVLYPRPAFAAEHAEALSQAASCFDRLKQGTRATELKNELLEKYPESPYARALTQGKAGTSKKETGK